MKRLAPSLVVVFGASLAIALGLWSEVRAGTLPDISGTWYTNGNRAFACRISQSGSSVSLTNEQGATATGQFVDPSSLTTNWGIFAGGTITGRISGDLRIITWNNGTYWSRPSAPATTGNVASGYVAPTPAPTPKPYRYLRWTAAEGARAPIDYVDGWTAVMRNGSMVYACVSFKNTSGVTATRIRFDFPLSNQDGQVVDTARLDRKGTFSPNVEIHGWHDLAEWSSGQGHRGYYDNCVRWKPDNEEERLAYSRLQHYSIRVVHIDFTDGTAWPVAEPEPSPSP